MKNIRNFSIIAHIDHGKSTLADRMLEYTHTIRPEKLQEQYLDSMDLEREKGITIKMHPVRMEMELDGERYILNLIDTPGHVDFNYEVSRSLAACEGAILLVDASQGVEAQTITNFYLALAQNLEIIPVINKIDLPNAQIEKVEKQIYDLTGEIPLRISAKLGWGIDELMREIVKRIPPPKGDPEGKTRALIFDAKYEDYRGVIVFVRVFDGVIKPGMKIMMKSSGKTYEVVEVGYLKPDMVKTSELKAGEVGYLTAAIREITEARVGDTIVDANYPETPALPGYREPKPVVFAGIYPTVPSDYELLAKAINKLKLNDASLQFTPEYSPALGPGFRCGFLGMLHMEIFKERLKREFGVDIVITTPNVEYKVILEDGREMLVDNPADFPDVFEKALEPYAKVEIITPKEFLGAVQKLCISRRGTQTKFNFLDEDTVFFEFEMPLSEIIFDFHDKLKSITRGYASFDYEIIDYRESDVVRLDFLVAGDKIDALSLIVHKDNAYYVGRKIAEKLRKEIPRQLFEVTIQAAIGKRVIAKERIPPIRKDVTAKCYGGDITRKRKLLEKQKEGKKKLKKIGKVELPQEAFLNIVKVEE
ncbi:MAG: translation elongation factor 4 [candidate division WOR-3 bacterium]